MCMPVTANVIDSVLVVSYQIGTDAGGAPIIRERSFTGVKSTAADQDVYDVMQALFALQQHPLTGVRRQNRFDLV